MNWGPFDQAGQDSSLQSNLLDDDGFGEFQTSTADSSASFDDSFDGYKTIKFQSVITPANYSKDIAAAVDDAMDEPTTPKASTKRLSLSSSFEAIDKPDQEESWSSVWPTPNAPPSAEDSTSSKATSDAVADAMTSHIVPR